MSAVIAAVGVMAVGTALSASAQNKSAKAQKSANIAQQRAASADAQRERIKAIREARIRAAQVEAAGGNMGMGQQSSGIAGSIASIGSQAASNIGNINVQEGFAQMASDANARAGRYSAQAAAWQGLASIGSTIFSATAPSAFGQIGKQVGDISKGSGGTIFNIGGGS